MVEWFYGRDGEHSGPVSEDELASLAKSGKLLPSDVVWHEQLDDWQQAADVLDVFDGLEVTDDANTDSSSTSEVDRTTGPPPFPDIPQSTHERGVLARAGNFAVLCTTETLKNIKRLVVATSTKRKSSSLKHALMDGQIRLANWMCENSAGDESLRRQIAEANDRWESLRAGQGSTKQMDAELRGLKVRLADTYSLGDDSEQPAEATAVCDAQQALAENAAAASQLRSELWPTDRRLHLVIGYTACLAFVCTVLFLFTDSREVVAGVDNEKQLGQALGLVVTAADVTEADGSESELPLGTGTCFAVTTDGYLITNKHVIEPVTKLKKNRELQDRLKSRGIRIRPLVWVFFGQDSKYKARIEHVSEDFDLAILKIDAEDLPVFQLASADEFARASKVYACGFPGAANAPLSDEEVAWTKAVQETSGTRRLERQFKPRDFEFVLTGGQISRMSREKEGRSWVQHDAEISPGNSGGPLILENGLVVGINTLTHTEEAGVSWALSLAQLKEEIGGIVGSSLLWVK